MNPKELQSLIEGHRPEARERVERTVKQWNQTLRDHLRAETGLRLSFGNRTQSVAVRVENGAPRQFAETVGKFQDWLPLLLVLPQLEAAIAGLKILESRYDTIIKNNLNGDARVAKEEIVGVQNFTVQTIQNLKKQEILDSLGKIEEDLLGAYFFYKKEICIYWAPIALLADILGVSIESLTVITLAHELAHAYTHLGYDIDGDNWKTDAFRDADLFICEGLAEWFTTEVIGNFYERNYELIEAAEKLAAIYDAKSPYVINEYWQGGILATSEVVRLAMLKCRKLNMTDYKDFEKLLIAESDAMPKSKKDQAPLFAR